MDEITQLKWFHFRQNNSGGSFVVDKNVSHHVFIQAANAADTIAVGEKFFDNSDSCECCGERWSCYVSDNSGNSLPFVYDEPLENYNDIWMEDWGRLHYYDGRVEVYPPSAAQLT